MSPRTTAHLGVLFASVFCALFAFWPVLDNGFREADFVPLEAAVASEQDAAELVRPWLAPYHRPLAQLAFYAEFASFGLRPDAFYWTHVLLHALNAALAFALFRGPLGPPVAAAAAVLFALGIGFYGEALLELQALPRLLVTGCVLATGIVALRAQRERTPKRRLAATLIAATFFTAALSAHETGLMALVMLGGLMWPHRRSLSSLARKLVFLGLLGIGYVFVVVLQDEHILLRFDGAMDWLSVPLHTLRAASLFILPMDLDLADDPATFSERLAALLEQARPLVGFMSIAVGGFVFVRGGGALRWLLASSLGFLIAEGFAVGPDGTPRLAGLYLPGVFVTGALAFGFRHAWGRASGAQRWALAGLLVLMLFGSLRWVRESELRADADAALQRERVEELRVRLLRLRGAGGTT